VVAYLAAGPLSADKPGEAPVDGVEFFIVGKISKSIGGLVGVAVFVFELEEVVASCLGDGLCL
jgi:hypothetical protein